MDNKNFLKLVFVTSAILVSVFLYQIEDGIKKGNVAVTHEEFQTLSALEKKFVIREMKERIEESTEPKFYIIKTDVEKAKKQVERLMGTDDDAAKFKAQIKGSGVEEFAASSLKLNKLPIEIQVQEALEKIPGPFLYSNRANQGDSK